MCTAGTSLDIKMDKISLEQRLEHVRESRKNAIESRGRLDNMIAQFAGAEAMLVDLIAEQNAPTVTQDGE
jgi:hypothetical protein